MLGRSKFRSDFGDHGFDDRIAEGFDSESSWCKPVWVQPPDPVLVDIKGLAVNGRESFFFCVNTVTRFSTSGSVRKLRSTGKDRGQIRQNLERSVQGASGIFRRIALLLQLGGCIMDAPLDGFC